MAVLSGETQVMAHLLDRKGLCGSTWWKERPGPCEWKLYFHSRHTVVLEGFNFEMWFYLNILFCHNINLLVKKLILNMFVIKYILIKHLEMLG